MPFNRQSYEGTVAGCAVRGEGVSQRDTVQGLNGVVVAQPEWMKRGSCRLMVAYGAVSADLWYPPQGEVGGEALAICGGCPVREECLEATLADEAILGKAYGIAGGLTANQRTRRLSRMGAKKKVRGRWDNGTDSDGRGADEN